MNFLKQAITLAEEILAVSSALQLTGQPKEAEREVDAYAELLDKREPMIAKLTQLINQDMSGDAETKKKLDAVLSKILECEKEHQRIMEHLKKSVTASLKETRSSQRLNEAYVNPYAGLGRSILDAKQ